MALVGKVLVAEVWQHEFRPHRKMKGGSGLCIAALSLSHGHFGVQTTEVHTYTPQSSSSA